MIDLPAIAAKAVNRAFDLTASITKALTFKQQATTGYAPEAGTVSPTYTNVAVTGFFGEYSAKETDGQRVLTGDKRLLVKKAELPDIVPAMSDRFDEADGTVWQVFDVRLDPTGTLYKFQVRKTQA